MKNRFIVGKWYIWKGPKDYEDYVWCPTMEFILDGKSHLCTKNSGSYEFDAAFDGGIMWSWGEDAAKFIVESSESIIEKMIDGINETI